MMEQSGGLPWMPCQVTGSQAGKSPCSMTHSGRVWELEDFREGATGRRDLSPSPAYLSVLQMGFVSILRSPDSPF